MEEARQSLAHLQIAELCRDIMRRASKEIVANGKGTEHAEEHYTPKNVLVTGALRSQCLETAMFCSI